MDHADRVVGFFGDLLVGDNPIKGWKRHPVTRRHSSRSASSRGSRDSRDGSPKTHDKRSSENDSGRRRLSGSRRDRRERRYDISPPRGTRTDAAYASVAPPPQPTFGGYNPSGRGAYYDPPSTDDYSAHGSSTYSPATFAPYSSSIPAADDTMGYAWVSEDEEYYEAEAAKDMSRRTTAASRASQRFAVASDEPADPTQESESQPEVWTGGSWNRTSATPYPPGWDHVPGTREGEERFR